MTVLFGGHAPKGMQHIECAECLMPFTVQIGEGLPESHKCDPQYARQAKAARAKFGSKPYPAVKPRNPNSGATNPWRGAGPDLRTK